MTNRRERGQGSIRKRAGHPATPWQGQVRISGKRLSVYGATRQEVADKLDRERRRAKEGLPSTDERLTLGGYLEEWMQKPPGRPIRERTLHRYRSLLRLHVVPIIGKVKLAQLRPEDVRRVIDRMTSAGLTAQTTTHARACLRRALRDAVRDQRATRNVASGDFVDVPTPKRHKVRPLSPADARKILDATRDDRLGPLYALGLATGARLGELLGLRWTDVHDDRGEIEFAQTFGRVGGQPLWGSPKNESSERTFPITTAVRAALLDQKRRQQFGLTGDPPKDLDGHGPLVFTSTTGEALSGTYVTQHLHKLLNRASLPPMRFHDLRHGTATLLFAQGAEIETISKLLGHASPTITRTIYVGVIDEKKRETAALLDDLFVADSGS